MAVDVLGDGVHDNVGSEIQRVLDVRGQKGVVNDDQNAVAVGDFDDLADVDQTQGRVTRAFDPDKAGIFTDVLRNANFNLGGKGYLDSVGLGDLSEVAVGAAVDVGDGDDVGASSEALEDIGSGCRAGGLCKGIAGMLKGGNSRLEVSAVGVGRARVLKDADGLAHGGLGKGSG